MNTPYDTLAHLDATIASRRGADPASSYIAKLLAKAPDAPLKKVAEEAGEFDLWFHSLVALAHFGLSAQEVLAELARREGTSGLAEKAARPKD